jgi:hypothetical protein
VDAAGEREVRPDDETQRGHAVAAASSTRGLHAVK